MEGGLGDDSYLVDSRNDKIVEFRNEGIDTVRSSQSWTLHTNLEHLTLIGSSNLYGGGNAKANIIIGNDGNNTLYGGALGDELKGGDGVDTFLYLAATDSTVDSPDRILDLRFNEFIDLSAIDANSTINGDQAFALVDEFTGAAGQMTLSYAADTTTTTVLMDINGDGVADMRILLSGNHEDHTAWMF
ncbi:M10 family metallopeptidase C-terminal domain-containing protein [Brevundimonas abyssalis]|uniref:M10 family metallopeptidase C-terminal domain-containing protein n=1 Tax=Brevundimonas abyssalis TaxID=1125965 RepID=UPI00130D595B|nr:M10 family metallopeptidase C-terminal domain-containing protein [Brevundimonas abyssalis]